MTRSEELFNEVRDERDRARARCKKLAIALNKSNDALEYANDAIDALRREVAQLLQRIENMKEEEDR